MYQTMCSKSRYFLSVFQTNSVFAQHIEKMKISIVKQLRNFYLQHQIQLIYIVSDDDNLYKRSPQTHQNNT